MKSLMTMLMIASMTGCVSQGYHRQKMTAAMAETERQRALVDFERTSCDATRRDLAKKDARLRMFNQLNDNGSLRGNEPEFEIKMEPAK